MAYAQFVFDLAANPAGVMVLLAAICVVIAALRRASAPVLTTALAPAVAVRPHLAWTTVSREQSPTAPGHTQPRAPATQPLG